MKKAPNIKKDLNASAAGPGPARRNLEEIYYRVATVDLIAEIGKIIVQKDADSAFISSAYNGLTRTALALLEKGANIAAKDENKNSALHAAVINGNLETVVALVEKGADVNARNALGWTPMHTLAALKNANPGIVVFLKERGANLRALTRDGKTARKIAGDVKNLDWCFALRASWSPLEKETLMLIYPSASPEYIAEVKKRVRDLIAGQDILAEHPPEDMVSMEGADLTLAAFVRGKPDGWFEPGAGALGETRNPSP